MINFFTNIKNYLFIFKNINSITSKKYKVVFYSESKNYQKYALILIDFLITKFPGEILYVSSDKLDFINNDKIKNLYIGKGLMLQYFFSKIQALNLITTTTDLGNNIIKKNKFVDNYIYYFHAPVSTTRVYTTKAFDNYDTILCIGNFQINEILKREKIKKINKKKLHECGYFYFDYLINKINLNHNKDEILIAPSWNYNEKNFINEDFENIIDELIKKNLKVRFRPHPEHFKRSRSFIEKISKKFNTENFTLDTNLENIESMEKAICLITDNSGIAIEFSLIMKKPVLYFDSLSKIHNKEVDDYKELINLEDEVRDNFGYKFSKNEIHKLKDLINLSKNDFNLNKKKNIDKFLDLNFFNISKTKFFLEKNINNILI
jgi:YidC/Oxa1 family membrane protein insertase